MNIVPDSHIKMTQRGFIRVSHVDTVDVATFDAHGYYGPIFENIARNVLRVLKHR